MERNALVDKLKGYACFLVLFGHVIMGIRNAGIEMPAFFFGLEQFIWSYHVPLFLFLSGVVYKITGEWTGKKTRGNFLRHKLINLGVPYVVFSTVYILINSFVGKANTPTSAKDILFIWKTPVAQYWYLYALFFLFVLWTGLSGSMKNYQITLFVVLFGYIAPFFGVGFGSFDIVIYSAVAFGLGTFVSVEKTEKTPWGWKLFVIALHIAAGVVFVRLGIIEEMFVEELMIILGILASIFLISLLQKLKPIDWFLTFMNKYSFQTYLLHTIFTAGIRIVLQSVGIYAWQVHVLLGTIFGIVLSVVCAFVAQKTKVFDLFFFPTKAWKALRAKS